MLYHISATYNCIIWRGLAAYIERIGGSIYLADPNKNCYEVFFILTLYIKKGASH
jgi:hypothetical protein